MKMNIFAEQDGVVVEIIASNDSITVRNTAVEIINFRQQILDVMLEHENHHLSFSEMYLLCMDCGGKELMDFDV